MSFDLRTIIDKDRLQVFAEPLSVEQLEQALVELHRLIAERRHASQDRELKRKGDRVLDDMRGLMAKAGISMNEFQQALERL